MVVLTKISENEVEETAWSKLNMNYEVLDGGLEFRNLHVSTVDPGLQIAARILAVAHEPGQGNTQPMTNRN